MINLIKLGSIKKFIEYIISTVKLIVNNASQF